MKNIEIERKFLVKKQDLPKDYKKYNSYKIVQSFIYIKPAIRLRKVNNKYILTIKEKLISIEKSDLARKEHEFFIPKALYDALHKLIIGREIVKRRYNIPYKFGDKKYTIELDIFEKELKGLIYAEVEFDSIKDANRFIPPSWFYRDVTSIEKYKNTSLSICKDIKSMIKY